MFANPMQTSRRGNGQAVAAPLINQFVKTMLDQVRRFCSGARVNIGAGPDFPFALVIKNKPFPHAGGSDCGNLFWRDFCAPQDLANALANSGPGAIRFEHGGARILRNARRNPFTAALSDLTAAKIENERASTARSGIDGQNILHASAATESIESTTIPGAQLQA